ncbi:MAG TPA: M67 family metallopeptidase [Rhizomicrobium sp.]|jgi:proteasome lid subunit RPN8/RPN11
MIHTLVLSRALRKTIEKAARAAHPRECCGLLEGTLLDHSARVSAVHAARNLAQAADRFEIDPAEHIRLLRSARENGRAIVGCYHSHPDGKAQPSDCDRENGSDEEFVWLIAAAKDNHVELAAFAFAGDAFTPVTIAQD